jgi:hypothetical protein
MTNWFSTYIEDILLPPPLPALPAVQEGVYYVRSDGSDSADGQTQAWLTINRANSAPSGSTINFWGGEAFPGSLTPPVGATITSFGTGQAQIHSGYTVLNNYNTLTNVSIVLTDGDFGINIAGHDVSVNNCTIGGTSPTTACQNGIYVNYYTYNIFILNNEIKNIGGSADNPTQSGFGIHTNGIFLSPTDTTPVPFTYSAGVPTNALLEIAHNTIHDCGGNMTNTGGGGPSGIEIGQGDRQWVHDNTVYYVRPVGPFYGGTDFDPIDAGDDGSTNCLCERNFCYGCYGGLIDFASAGTWGPSIIRYNLVIDCGVIFANNVIQDWGNGETHQVYGNTFVQTTGVANTYNVWFFQPNISKGVWANNIVYTIQNSRAFRCDGTMSSTFVMNNNCWFGGALFEYNGETFSPYSVAVANIPYFDPTGITSDPLFVGTAGSLTTTDYKLQSGSPCLIAGINLSAAPYNLDVGSTDLFGNTVTSGTPNIGCHAY